MSDSRGRRDRRYLRKLAAAARLAIIHARHEQERFDREHKK